MESRIRIGLTSVFVSLLVSFNVANAADIPSQLMPNDEASRDPSFVEFRDQLISVVHTREHERLIGFIDPRINNGPDVQRGAQAFVQKWDISNVESELWAVLEPILKLGGGFIRSEVGVEFCAPYVFTDFPGELSRFKHGVILDSNVKLMTEPNSASVLVGSLTYDIVKVPTWHAVADANGTPNLSWILVNTLDGRMGYVASHAIRSPAQYSACFLQRDDKDWKMISLMAR